MFIMGMLQKQIIIINYESQTHTLVCQITQRTSYTITMLYYSIWPDMIVCQIKPTYDSMPNQYAATVTQW